MFYFDYRTKENDPDIELVEIIATTASEDVSVVTPNQVDIDNISPMMSEYQLKSYMSK